jgi:hypothetical protein
MKTEVESIRQKKDSLKGMVGTLLGGIPFYVFTALIADGDTLFLSDNRFLAPKAETTMEVQVVKAR